MESRPVSEQPLLSQVEVFSKPFPYLLATEAFREETCAEILDWLETDAPWKLIETDFYEQYEFSLADALLPTHLSFLIDAEFQEKLTARAEGLFNLRLCYRIDVTAHKLVPGQRIRIHNDFISGRETCRILIQLNRHWAEECGGFLLLFNSSNPADVHRIFRPLNNTMMGFAITPNSHHAVSAVHQGERYTLVYSFYSND